MTYRKVSRSLCAAILLLAAGSPLHAEPLERDTGIGREIAEQGNIALRLIRVQARLALERTTPTLRDVRVGVQVARERAVARGAGTTFAPATSVLAAK